MRIKNKDIELMIEHVKKTAISEAVDIYFSDDSYGVIFEYTDKQSHLARIKLFDANLNSTPEINSIKKLYRED